MLLATITRAAGSVAPVRAGQTKHLRPAIQLLTAGEGRLRVVRRFERTGWADGRFLIPGREPPDLGGTLVAIRLPRKLPYRIASDADLEKGLEGFVALLESMSLKVATVATSLAFTAPLARLTRRTLLPLHRWPDRQPQVLVDAGSDVPLRPRLHPR